MKRGASWPSCWKERRPLYLYSISSTYSSLQDNRRVLVLATSKGYSSAGYVTKIDHSELKTGQDLAPNNLVDR